MKKDTSSISLKNKLNYKEVDEVELTEFYSEFFTNTVSEEDFMNYAQNACAPQMDETLKALSEYLSKEFGFTAKEFGFINY